MRLLAIDTALAVCSAAVLDTARGEPVAFESQAMERGHAEALMPMIARVMGDAGLSFFDLDRIAVTSGPGSFTGLRVGIAAARGIALSIDRPAYGLTTLAAFAAPLIAQDDATPVAVAVDARHSHVYLQVFGPGGRTLIAPRIASLHDAAQSAAQHGARIAGNAADLVAAQWPAGLAMPGTVAQSQAPEIVWVGRLGAAASGNHGAPRPLYLRAPDAQPQDAARLPRR